MNADTVDIAEEDRWRVITYRLLARLLAAEPDASVIQMLQAIDIQTEETALTKAWYALAQVSHSVDLELLEQEYNALFIGFTSGEVIPYASRYLTGFLMEKPLAKLRQDLIHSGIQRQQSVYEPEDHIAAVFEAMSLLIESADDAQWTFLNQHVLPWAQQFFKDIQLANSAQFYKPVGQLGEAFVALESTLFTMEQNQ
ncbi:MAG: molecular chaperone TorD family protein [Methylococcales bacterium]